jgi:flagellar hook-length control protein FliK
MAAPISPVSIGAPVELVAPQPVAANKVHSSNKGQQGAPFKQHLNNASEKHQYAKDQKHEIAQHKSDKSRQDKATSEQLESTKSASSLNAADTNAAKANQVPANQGNQNASVEKQNSAIVTEKNPQVTETSTAREADSAQASDPKDAQAGKELPQTGKELPQVSQGEKLPGSNDTAISAEALNAALLNIPAQVASETVSATVTTTPSSTADQALLDANKTINVGQTQQGIENSQAVKAGQAVTPVQPAPNSPGQTSNTAPLVDIAAAAPATVNAGDKLVTPSQISQPNQVTASQQGESISAIAGGVRPTATTDITGVQTSQISAKDTNAQSIEQTKPSVETKQQSSQNQTQVPVTADSKVSTPQSSVVVEQNKPAQGAGIQDSLLQPDQIVKKEPVVALSNRVNSEQAKEAANSQNVTNVNAVQPTVKSEIGQGPTVQSAVNTSELSNATVNNVNASISQGIADSASEGVTKRNTPSVEVGAASGVDPLNKTSAAAIKDNLLASAVKTSVEQSAQSDKGPVSSVNPGTVPQNNQNIAQSQINVAESATPIMDKSLALNQSLEKMRAGIDSTAIKDETGEAAQAKHAGTKVISSAEGLQQLASMQNGLRSTAPVQMQMPPGTPPSAKNWGKAVADKVYIAASQNLRVANIHLDPPELGALQVRLQVTGPDQQMSVSFTSPHASVRDTLEQQLPRLREMLEEQGINLGESSVNDQRDGSGQMAGDSESNSSGGYGDSSDPESSGNPLNTQGTLSLVDFYA